MRARPEIHYEVFKRRGPGSGWSLVDALYDRQAAVKRAEALIDGGEATGVKVVKETYNEETGDYMSLILFERGDTKDRASKQGGPAELPCFRPQDLYTCHARATVARLLTDYLKRERLTAIELLHNAKALEKLNATGTVLQHAIQKAAVAHASASGQNVQSAVRQLNTLVDKASERVYKDGRQGRISAIGKGGLAGCLQAIGKSEETEYWLCSAIALHLDGANSWSEKLTRCLSLMNTLPSESDARDMCLEALDHFVSEMLAGQTAIRDLMGERNNLGDLLLALTALFLGRIDDIGTVPDGTQALCTEFRRGKLSYARAAIAQRILRELKSANRLVPECFEREVSCARKLATRLVEGQGPHLPLEDITEAFDLRSKRLVAGDAIEAYLERFSAPLERMHKVMAIEENIIGIENKRYLTALLLPILTAHGTETAFVDGAENPVQKLQAIAALQRRIQKSGLEAEQKAKLTAACGSLGQRVEDRLRFLEAIVSRNEAPLDIALALLRLMVAGVFPEGTLLERAKVSVLKILRDPAFASAMAKAAEDQAVSGRIAELKDLMQKADLGKSAAA